MCRESESTDKEHIALMQSPGEVDRLSFSSSRGDWKSVGGCPFTDSGERLTKTSWWLQFLGDTNVCAISGGHQGKLKYSSVDS